MQSLLKKRATLNCFLAALILSAALDALSTLYAAHWAGTWDVEANPVFRGLARATSGMISPVVLVFALKAITVGVLTLWLRLTLSRVPDLYPPLGGQSGFFQFLNFLFCGVVVSGWRSFFLVPSVSRLYRGLSVPVTLTVILGTFSASIVNTFHLVDDAVTFWVAVSGIGAFAGLEMLRRDFLTLSRYNNSQPGDAPNGGSGKPFTDSVASEGRHR